MQQQSQEQPGQTQAQEGVEIIVEPTEEESEQPPAPIASKAVIYSASYCPHCTNAIQWFQQNNIEYEVIDITDNQEKQDELEAKAGQVVVPVIEAGNEIVIGFNEEKLSELFGVE